MLYAKRLSILGILFALLMACAAPPPNAAPATTSAAPAEAEAEETSTIISWYYFDQNNTDPQANERVGNFYLARAIPQFNEQFAGQYVWENVPRDYNLVLDLVAAVQNNGDIPDVMRTATSDLPTFLVNNTVQDLTEFVQGAEWFADLDPAAVAACTGPDGKIYCVPVSQSPYVVFYWTEHYPDGFPTTTDDFLAQAEALKGAGVYATTYWGSTAFDGEAAGRYFYQVISSFGGGYDDGQGNMRLNTPENIAAIEFMRQVVANSYSPESVFVGNFEEEASFKTAEAAAFPTGFYVAYSYLNPLTAPDGTEFNSATAKDMEEAVAAGQIGITPLFAPEGQTPGCNLDVFGFVIPNGAKNRAGAEAYINWVMDPANAVDWVLNAGGGWPVSQALLTNEAFQTDIFQQGIAAGEASNCKPWQGSLLNIPDAKKIIANTVYDLIHANPDADIAEALARAEEEYNSNQ
jgi:multiple sugar transport system substrate-binding protein